LLTLFEVAFEAWRVEFFIAEKLAEFKLEADGAIFFLAKHTCPMFASIFGVGESSLIFSR